MTPLEIPELLCLIFSYLDPFTLAVSVVPVCRQWFLLSRHRLSRTVTWDINWQPSLPKYALSSLPGAEHLVLGCAEDGYNWNGPNVLGALKSLQKRPIFPWSTFPPIPWPQDKEAAHIKRLLDRPLHHLVLTVSFNFTNLWWDSLSLPLTLTSLTIEKKKWMYIDVPRILVVCPLLESLHLFCVCSKGLNFQGPLMNQGNKALPDRLRLQSLVLEQPRVQQSWMEDLLAVTPDLKELQLITIFSSFENNWEWSRFRDHLRALSLPLERFHFSLLWKNTVDEEELKEVMAVCPKAKEHSILAYYMTPGMKKQLVEWPVFLTTLEILQPRRFYDAWSPNYGNPDADYSARDWHQLLCQCPNLRHLKTLKMPYRSKLMDLHHRIPMYSSTESSPIQPGVWICRRLETLHMELHAHENATMRGVDYKSVECEIAELNWLCRSGRNEEHRARRRQLVEGWTWRLEQEAALDMEREKNRTAEDSEVIGAEEDSDNLMMMKNLRNLGLLQDVKDVLLEMDRRNFEYLPELQEVACGDHLPQRPEKEIRSLFYMKPPG
ncbi:hypothetical protein BGZ97_008360, partial [Linnemannia gamsii]